MTTVELLSHLRSLDVRLWVEGERLRYSAPDGVMTSALRAKVVERRAEIIAFLTRDQGVIRSAVTVPILPVSREGELPLSSAQQRLWFLDELAPPNPAYNLARALRLTGPLDMVALEQSLNEIIKRHEALRTDFAAVNGRPVQVIAPELTLALPIVDLRKLSEPERETQIQQIVAAEARRTFDLTRGPFLRTTLLQLDEQAHILLLTMHHIVFDGWSVDVLFRELGTLYEAFSRGEPSPLPELPIQYADFAVWQQQWLQSETMETSLAYWKGQLGDVLTVLELPADHPRPPVQTFRGETLPFVLSASLLEGLVALSQQEGATLFMTLLAAFQVLLHHYTGREHFLVGTPTANRNRSEVEGLIGFFVNTLVLYTNLSGNPSFWELLARVKKMAMGAFAHQDLPFEKLVEELQPERDMGRQPLCQVMFAFENSPAQTLTLPGLELDMSVIHHGTAKFDLILSIENTGQELKGSLEYSTDLFEPATITRLAAHFQTLLEGIVANPDQRLSDLPLLTGAERYDLLVGWNGTEADYPQDRCIHELFEMQVAQEPNAVALVYGDQRVTYQELNQRANQLAHHLQALGVGPEMPVGICVERSVDMVVGLLGILKAGGAYVPLDPVYPKERLGFMLQDAQVCVLLTHEHLLPDLPGHGAQIVCLDSDWPVIGQKSFENPVNELMAEHLAYVIYTSGSTGKPKGVVVSHGALVSHCQDSRAHYQLDSSDGVLQFASTNFDVSLEQILPTLIAGARLVLRGTDMWSAADFYRNVMTMGLTVVNFAPAYWHQLVQEWVRAPESAPNEQLRLVIVGGDVMPFEGLRLYHQTPMRSVRLLNAYGPTETTITATIFEIPSRSYDEDTRFEMIPIGRPVANMQTYLLNAHLQPVPVGVLGELYIGGVGMARGYLDRPKLTAEKFIPHPFSQEPGARLYRTGDVARYLSDGNIEFLGRTDHQVKVRGFRIELGEIEAVLERHPAVQSSIVLVWEGSSGEHSPSPKASKRLVAYMVPQRDTAPSVGELRDYMKEKLPPYMIPSAFVTLEALPLLPNGKVNRRALPVPEGAWADSEADYVPPRTPMEEVLAGIWAYVLGVEQVGVHDDFFDLGGHSLLATQIMSRVRDAFRVELPLQALFETPQVADLAEQIEAARRAERELCAPPRLSPVAHGDKIPLSFAQQRLWFLDQWERGKSPFYNIPAALHLDGRLDVAALEQSLSEIIRRHQALRTIFVAVDGEPAQTIVQSPAVTLPIVNLAGLDKPEQQDQVRRLTGEDAQRPFDLSTGPLMRTTLLRLGAEEHVLLMNMHHIVSDGWSLGILIRELKTLYRAFLAGEPSPLPELPIQYSDFAVWQRQWLQGEMLDAQLAYWKQRLGGDLATLKLPTDRPRPAVQTLRGAGHSFMLPKGLSQALETLSRQEGATLFMVLLATFKVLLHRYTGQTDVAVGTPIVNRNWSEIEDLIGFFANTLVMRSDLSGQPTFRELLAQVRKATLEDYAHQDLPFEMLVEALQPERDLSYTPLFQVMFVFQNMPLETLELPGLVTNSLETDGGTAKFDLTLFLKDTEQGLNGMLEYNTDLFDEATIARLAGHFQTMLEGIVADPDQLLSDLPLLTETEEHELLIEWNDTSTAYPEEQCIHQLFEAQVERTPNAVALVFEDQILTYWELNRRANQLAHYLQGMGVGPESLVGICVQRSVEMVVGLLAILKAGAAYVPLDPTHPKERLAFILEDAQMQVLLSQRRFLDELSPHSAQVICLDADWQAIAHMPPTNPLCISTSGNLAYIIYTSGSTGWPKGVAIPHCATVAMLSWAGQTFSPQDLAGVLAATTICFDLSVYELFLPLSQDGAIILAEDALHLPSLPARESVTLINTVPSAIAELVRAQGIPDSVRTVNLAGEALKRTLVQNVYAQGNVERVYNLYGPSEDTTYSTFTLVERDDPQEPTIGRPIYNTQAYILDAELHPVPVGVVGELYLSGDGLSRGYLNWPGLTAERFIPNPFSRELGGRLYWTGDLARYLPSGDVEFLGRADYQVKIRGYRIELGEIEVVLGQHPGVWEVVVAALTIREDDPGDKQLVAYVVPNEEQEASTGGLRRFLQERLPEYMVPSLFVMLDALPLTPSGKVDRRALPAPDRTRLGMETAFTAPRTPTEEVLASIWTQVLRVEQVGINDNFFELGGHSLLATRLTSRVRDAFRVELPLRMLFEAPTVADLAERVEAARRAELCRHVPPITPTTHEGHPPLSFAQQRLWFLDQMDPGNVSYNFPAPMCLVGPLDITALEQSLSEIVRRHQSLRTTFAVVDGEPVQVIASSLALQLPLVDLGGLPESRRDGLARSLATEDAHQPFDLAQGPLVRATLLRLDAEEHVLLLNMHHIVSDGWSGGLLFHELATLYRAFSAGEPSPLPELPIQYADFAAWQRQWLQGAVLETQLDYWKQQLGGDLAILELPTDRPRPAVQTFQGAAQSLVLPSTLSQALKALSQEERGTLFMTLLAAFKVLLHRYTGQTDVIVGTPIAGRNWSEIEDLIGFFINTLVMRTDLSGNPTFRTLLSRVREVALDAYAHQDLPFEKLLEELEPERDLSHSPLFQVMFVLQNVPRPEQDPHGLSLSSFDLDIESAKYDLTMSVWDTGQELDVMLNYRTDLFDAGTIDRLMAHFQTLLEGIVANPDQRLSDLPLLTEAERRRMLVAWNRTRADYPRDACIHGLFEAQARRTPDEAALVFEGQSLSYRELDERANRLAHHLQRLGVRPETLVGICVKRSIEMVVGILGILKAGGAYVPLDPAYPKERLAFMLNDAQVSVLLTQQRLLDNLPEHPARTVCLDTDWGMIARESGQQPAGEVTSENPIYVIYTSGSTGRPKGGIISHSSVVNHALALAKTCDLGPGHRFLQFVSLSFDASAEEIFPTLLSGATLVLPGAATEVLGRHLLQFCEQEGITILHLPASVWHQWVDDIPSRYSPVLPALTTLLVGGESADVNRLRAWARLVGRQTRFLHCYGLTEATITSTIYEAAGDVEAIGDLSRVPIGQPITNVHVYLLDEHLRPVPVGVPGELCIGGAGVGRGYLNRPSLTAEKFIPNPFDGKAGSRLYRSGDLARYLPDGNVEFLGRIDDQIKIRGFRIEPGEIEAVLTEHEVIQDALVVARSNGASGKELVAYLVANQEQVPPSAELRQSLQTSLPDYMIPTAFVTLDAFPLMVNGKVDRRALPAPVYAGMERESAFVAPATPYEEILAEIWEEVLRVEKVGVQDNFFDLGGHSLLATQIVARVTERFEIELSVRALFEAPTIAEMGPRIEQALNAKIAALDPDEVLRLLESWD